VPAERRATKPGLDPRLLRIRQLYRDLDGIPGRRKAFVDALKEEASRLRDQIDQAWSDLLDETPSQANMPFTVHHGDRLVGVSRQPQRTPK
jgi:hypothetical protein